MILAMRRIVKQKPGLGEKPGFRNLTKPSLRVEYHHQQPGNINADTFERVRKIIIDLLGVEPDKVTREANFREDLEADSLDLVELIMEFEEEFGGTISDEEAQQVKTVGQVVDYIEQHMIGGA